MALAPQEQTANRRGRLAENTGPAGSGLSLFEAMAKGVPVISYSVGALPELLTENAVLVEPFSVDEFEISLKKLLNNAEYFQ